MPIVDLMLLTTAALWALMTFHTILNVRRIKRLPPRGGSDARILEPLPKCSVVLAACNEEDRIERTVRHLLAQVEVDLEVIIVDDRSTDRTPGIVASLALKDSRIQVLRVDQIPNGWLGKCHACHLGAQRATGKWILFTDADCWMKPDVIHRAIHRACTEQVEHVALTPGVAPRTSMAAAWHLAFLTSVAGWMAAVNRDKPGAHFGIGAFNLVQTQAYRASGGYEALRMTVLDDVKLGLLLRRSGHRTRAFIGGDDVECQWGVTAREMIGIMEKNYFAAIDYRTGVAIGGLSAGACMALITALGPWIGGWTGWAAPICACALVIPASICARRLGWTVRRALLVPFAYPLLMIAMFNSTWVTLRQGGVRWRGVLYPLAQLRAGTVR